MENNQISITEWIVNYQTGLYNCPDVDTQIRAGWYDWFCEDMFLQSRLNELGPKVEQINTINLLNNKKHYDPQNSYVFFKNNCPFDGELYDDFRICDMDSGNVIFTIVPASGHTSMDGVAELWGKANSFKEALAEGEWIDILNYFRN